MANVSLEILIILGLILCNGILAMAEIAIVSARKPRLRQRADEGHAGARTALELAENPNRFLSTVQIGITLIGIFAGAYGGATLSQKLALSLQRYEAIAPYSDELALTIVVIGITYLSLILGELVPKRLGLTLPEGLASVLARPMYVLSVIALPLVHLLSASTELVLRLLRVQKPTDPPVTEEEITLMIAEGAQAGIFEAEEQEMVERIFRFGDQTVGDVMTPRHDIASLDLDDPMEENLRRIAEEPHTHLVVCRDGLDHTIGIVTLKDLLKRSLAGEPLDLESTVRQPLYVPESLAALTMLDRFRRTGEQLALVVDEYGALAGLVTLDDILQAIVGVLPSLGVPGEPGMVQREDGSWLVDGMVSADDFKDHFDLRELPDEETGAFRTLGGFVVTYLGRIPGSGDAFEWNGFRFEVMDMDGKRVDKVLVTPPGNGEEGKETGG